jgi:hypothetical protein
MRAQKHLKSFNREELKTISELIQYLEEVKDKEGDIAVCYSEDHEYWGSIQTWITPDYNIGISDHAQPEGPKSGKSVKALLIGK